MRKVALGAVFVFALSLGFIIGKHYQLRQDITAWKNLAEVSSEPNDMYEWMLKVQQGMEKHNMTNGSSALIMKAPDNDMANIYRIVKNHVEQAEVLTKMDRSTPEYQTGLENLRGSIGKLDLQVITYWNVHSGWFAYFMLFISFFVIVFWLTSSK